MTTNAANAAMPLAAPDRTPRDAAPAPVHRTVEEVVQLEQRDRIGMSLSDRVASWMTAFSGSMAFVWLHAIWFGAWVAVNLGLVGIEAFDPFPFGLLTMAVSLEAIFLSTFVLISQNRQALQADRRAKVDLQVNLIAEEEITKLMQMVAAIHSNLGIGPATDREANAMQRRTDIGQIMDAIDDAERHTDLKGARGPRSAADTDA